MAYKPYRGYTWNISTYYPAALSKRTEKELRKEYSRLRGVAQKSIKRLGQSEFAGGATYRAAKNRFPTLKGIKSQRQLVMALTDVSQFLAAKSHSVSGLREIRAAQVHTWQSDYGYKFVTIGNYDAWVEFLETFKDSIGFLYEVREGRRYVNKADAAARREEIEKKFAEYQEMI